MKDPLNIPRVTIVKDRPLTEVELLRRDIREMIAAVSKAEDAPKVHLNSDQRHSIICTAIVCATTLCIALAIVQAIHG